MTAPDHCVLEECVGARGAWTRIVFAALVAAVAMVYATSKGIGLGPDSVNYVDAARHLARGEGVSIGGGAGAPRPLVHFPPLYPAVLAIPALFGADPLAAARWINVALFGLNVFLVGLLIRMNAPSCPGLPALGAIMAMGSADLIRVHALACSEPLFLFFTLASLGFLGAYLGDGRPAAVAASAAGAALAFLTRHVGAPLVAAGFLAILFWPPRSRRGRWGRWGRWGSAIAFGLIASAPMAAWAVRNRLVAGAATTAGFSFHLMDRETALVGLATVSRWVLPSRLEPVPQAVTSLFVLCCLGLFFIFAQAASRAVATSVTAPETAASASRDTRLFSSLSRVMALFVFVYLAFLFVSINFVYATTPLDGRILSPVFAAGVVVVVSCARRLLAPALGRPVIRRAAVAVAAAYALAYLASGASEIAASHADAQGYASRQWRRSPLIARLKAMPRAAVLVSNAPDAIYILTGRRADWVLGNLDAWTRHPDPNYEARQKDLAMKLRLRGGFIVLFKNVGRPLTGGEDLAARLSARALAKSDEGVIYEIETGH